jgi:hypothetical protein
MTNGQIAQLQDLKKCHLVGEDLFYFEFLYYTDKKWKLDKWNRHILRRLTHQYRNQIMAMRKNRQTKSPTNGATSPNQQAKAI